ncbi:MAG TPA: glycosyltransferase family 4 protein [Gemmatimonadales bacterium]|nr:glycosyltransferase family 4 protein [Gemmatimonadales bacterium]
MTTRPRVLFLAQCLPYPPDSGVTSRTFHILRELQVGFDVTLVPYFRVNHQPDAAARDAACEALRRVATYVADPTPIPGEHRLSRRIWDHVRSLGTGRPYTHYQYDSAPFAERLDAAMRAGPPDLVHLDSLDMHRWLPLLPDVPVACTHHDIDSELLRLRAQHLRSPLLRRYMGLQAGRVERLERELCPRLTLNVMMSDIDAQRLQRVAPGARTVVVPNGTDTDHLHPNGGTSAAGRVVFVGPTYSHPNRDAVEFFLQEIWPRIGAADPATSLQLVGRSAPADRARYDAEPGVQVLGQVPDIRPPLTQARCVVVPIRIGGGTRIKILDAWALGKAVVSTSIGCEGLDAVDGENILIRDTPGDFAAAVLEVLHDARLRAHLERNARCTALERYSWSLVGRRIRSAYAELLGRA